MASDEQHMQQEPEAGVVAGERFVFQFTSGSITYELRVPLLLPLKSDSTELAVRLVDRHGLPCYLQDKLAASLKEWARQRTIYNSDIAADTTMKRVMDSDKLLQRSIKHWTGLYTDSHAQFSIAHNVSSDVFPGIYQSLILSPAVDTVLQLEHYYSVAMGNLIRQRDEDVRSIEARHERELQAAMMREGDTLTDRDINTLTRQHVMEKERTEMRWVREISGIEAKQQQDYKDWLTRLYHEMNSTITTGGDKHTVLTSLQHLIKNVAYGNHGDAPVGSQPVLEESFTINLGSQKKTSHNLRLMCGNVLDLCRSTSASGRGFMLDPQQLQTAMSLYTSDVCALVMVEETGAVTSSREAFANVCQQSTDLHFPSITNQLSRLSQFTAIAKVSPAHSRNTSPYNSRENISSTPHSLAEGGNDTHLHPNWITASTEEGSLEPGDFYATRHSNLSQVHLVLHLITERKAVSSPGLSARHPIMQGLKTCLRTASQHGIHNVIIPLLLVHTMEPEMTITWCLKRAELVFKCVKGFMLEDSTWRGDKAWTVQFLIPMATSQDLFDQITDLLPKTFRIAATRDLSHTTLH